MSISTGELMDARDILETPMQMVWQETVMNIEAPEPKTIRDGCRGLGPPTPREGSARLGAITAGILPERILPENGWYVPVFEKSGKTESAEGRRTGDKGVWRQKRSWAGRRVFFTGIRHAPERAGRVGEKLSPQDGSWPKMKRVGRANIRRTTMRRKGRCSSDETGEVHRGPT